MALIVDASVAIKWFIDEPGSDAARRLWRDEADLLAPDLIVPEVCNAAWRKARIGQSHPAQVKEIAARLRHGVLELRPAAPLASRAVELALDLDHPVYDCFYLALAEEEKISLVTADRRLESRLGTLPGRPWYAGCSKAPEGSRRRYAPCHVAQILGLCRDRDLPALGPHDGIRIRLPAPAP